MNVVAQPVSTCNTTAYTSQGKSKGLESGPGVELSNITFSLKSVRN